MMSNEANESLRNNTQHVPLRQNTDEKVQGKELKAVWCNANEETRQQFFLFFFMQVLLH